MTDELDELFAEIREKIPTVAGKNWFSDKDFLVYIIIEDIEHGYRLARTMSAPARAMYDLTGGLNLYGNKHVGQDAGGLFKNDDPRSYPERCLFLYPEHDLVAKQQQAFVHEVCERPEIKQVIIITTSPLIVGDFFACQCKVVTGFEDPEAPPGKKLHVIPMDLIQQAGRKE